MTNTAQDRIIARDGVIELNSQFFLHQQDRAQSEFQHLAGEKTIAPEQIRRFQQNVDLSAAYCRSAGFPYLHLVYPSKTMAFRDAFRAAGVELVGIFSDAHKRDEVLYPLDDLVGVEDYETLDSHCSEPGYLKIARTAFRTLGAPIDTYRPIVTTRLRRCDLAHMRGLPEQPLETIRQFEGLAAEPIRFSNTQMLPGNRGKIDYFLNDVAPVRARVLMFGDSYFGGTMPVIAPLIRELIYLRCPYVMEDVANALEPDIILTGNAERYLVDVPDKTRDAPYFTQFFLKGVDTSQLNERNREALLALFSGRDSATFETWREKVLRRRARHVKRKTPVAERIRGALGLM